MKNIWIVLSNRSITEIYNWTSIRAKPRLVKKFECEEARLHTKEFRDDKSGRLFEHFSMYRHSAGKLHRENRDLMRDFSRDVANYVEVARKENRFTHLILVADPKVLGELRSHLSKTTLNKVIASKSLNPQDLTKDELKTWARKHFKTAFYTTLDA